MSEVERSYAMKTQEIILRSFTMKLYTIGYTKKSAQEFFETLKKNGVKRILDVRESNSNLFAGFTMKQNIGYFLKEICNIDYQELKILAPTKDIRLKFHDSGYKEWETFKNGYNELLKTRDLKNQIDKNLLEDAALLCFEPTADHCHRRLAAEHLKEIYPDLEIVHL
ncbi:MAG: hypothetical protein IFNCLDLE_00910 [Ignavibacteriaceae bacterium]|nr:hypothetical protein [Ignavibacteriaceae bacterium]